MRRLFRLLLRLSPRSFRARFGPEALDHAEEACRRAFRERGVPGGAWCVVAEAWDLAWSGMAERVSPAWTGDGDERERDGGVGTMTRGFLQDMAHAVRTLAKGPGFTLAATGTLALALGANAGIFAVVDAALLDPLPYDEPDRLVEVAASAPGADFPEEFGVSLEFFLQYRDEASRLDGLAMFNSFTNTVRAGDRSERLRVVVASPSLFPMLGVTPALGRLPEEDDQDEAVLVSHALWTTWFGSDPGVLGRSLEVLGERREIVGVLPPEVRFGEENGQAPVVWVPWVMDPGEVNPGNFGIGLIGRMAPGADHASLRRELDALADRLPELYGGSPAYARIIERHVPVVRSWEEAVVGPLRAPLRLLMGSVLVVLLIACANVANLILVRGERRGRDFAVRRAMGATRARLLRGQLAEGVVLAGLAGAAALVIAHLALPAFVGAAPAELPRIGEARLSPLTFAFTAGASLLAALLCGLGPALRFSAPDLGRLRDGGRGSSGRRGWARNALVVGQTALTLVLLVGSGLLLRSVQELRHVDPGYDTSGILTFQFAPEQARLADGPSWARFHLDFMERLRALPGVSAVGLVENTPLDEGVAGTTLFTEETAGDDAAGAARGSLTAAGGDYFEAMGIEVLRGRGFTGEDAEIPGRLVVSRSVAERLWPGENPVGHRLRTAWMEEWHTVVGVVEDVLQYDLRGEPEPLVYYPMVGPTPDAWALSSPGYAVRADDPASLVPRVRELIREVAPEAPVYRVRTMEELVSRSLVRLSFTMLTLGVAAGLAMILGALGLYGVLSQVVAERTREIGVRMALGAEARRVRWLVVGQGARVVGVGIVLGLAAAVLGSRLLSSLLYGVEAADPLTFGATAVGLAAVGLLASYLPARRASRVDPVRAMRAG